MRGPDPLDVPLNGLGIWQQLETLKHLNEPASLKTACEVMGGQTPHRNSTKATYRHDRGFLAFNAVDTVVIDAARSSHTPV